MEKSSVLKTAGQISDHVRGKLIGDASLVIDSFAPIEVDQANSITFFGNPKYEKYLYAGIQRAIIIPEHYQPDASEIITFIQVENVYEAVSKISEYFSEGGAEDDMNLGVNYICHPTADKGKNVLIGHFSTIGAHTSIGDEVRIGDQVRIGRRVKIGQGTIIDSGVKIYDDVIIGKRCVIMSNAVIGGNGFGFAPTSQGYKEIHHRGKVIIGDDVSIGSNTCIDRGALRDTILEDGVKLDNLIQIAHGVTIQKDVVIAAQSGISGSSIIGERSRIGGQVGVAGHVNIAAGSQIQAKSGVASSINEAKKKWYGYPIMSYFSYLRSFALFKRLPELFERIKQLENR